MANLYYNAAIDTAWDTLGNWWTDAAFTTPSVAIPADGDTAYLAATMYSGPSTAVTLNHIYVADASTGGGSFGVIFTGATGDATFNDSSYNAGTVTGNATFNDSSYNYYGTVTGDATFNDYSYFSYGTVTNPIFNDYSFIYGGTINGDTTFNDFSYNDGSITTNATFNDNSYTANGSQIIGNITFNDSSYNLGTVAVGPITFNDSSYNLGTVASSSSTTFNGIYVGSRVGGYYDGVVMYLNMTCPASGGSDQTIARLLNLPWFINL
jgi:hypothetical protein